MIDESIGTRRGTAWLLAPLGALVLYVGTWPPIEIKCSEQVFRGKVHVRHSWMNAYQTVYAPWTVTFYRPLHRLCQMNHAGKWLTAYWSWWNRSLGGPVVASWGILKP